VRSQIGPLVVIQIAAVMLVIAYYRSPEMQTVAAKLAGVKVAGGLLFSFLAGGVAGGAIPEFARLLLRRIPRFDRAWAATAGYNALVYGVVGVQVDLFYQLQGLVFGTGNDAQTLIVKTAVDMSLFTTVISIPTAVFLYAWKRRGFRFDGWRSAFSRRFYAKEVWPTLIPCWAFWIPVLLCVYAMPADLQFCFAVLAEAAWSMVFVFMVTRP
ncbi:MAG: hypothetical protein H6534_05455, partial [Chthonomonadaceae bacterium]|nr:hypothetical protein [Chthonomonadaceae bacterium]